jgi:hypothetical protein
MPKAIFVLLRVFAAVGALAVTAIFFLFEGLNELLKDGFHIGVVIAHFFASGLRNPGPTRWTATCRTTRPAPSSLTPRPADRLSRDEDGGNVQQVGAPVRPARRI